MIGKNQQTSANRVFYCYHRQCKKSSFQKKKKTWLLLSPLLLCIQNIWLYLNFGSPNGIFSWWFYHSKIKITRTHQGFWCDDSLCWTPGGRAPNCWIITQPGHQLLWMLPEALLVSIRDSPQFYVQALWLKTDILPKKWDANPQNHGKIGKKCCLET